MPDGRRTRRPSGTPRGRRTAAVLIALAVLAGVAGGLARIRVETGIGSFLPSSDPSVRQLDELARAYGGEPIVVLLESAKPRQLLDGDHVVKLVELEGRLSQLPDVAAVYGPGTILNQIAAQMQDLLAELSGWRDAVRARTEADARAKGASPAAAKVAAQREVDSFDARYGTLLVQGLPAGLPTLHNPAFADSVIFSQQPNPRSQWRFVVPNASSVAVLVRPRQGLDAAASQRLVACTRAAVEAAGLDARRTTVSGVPALVAGLSQRVGRDIPLLGVIGLIAVATCFLAVPWTRRAARLRPLLTTALAVAMTLAVYGWLDRPLSLGVVAFLPVLLGIGSYYPTYFARQRDRRVVFTVALATAASFATLALSPLPFVRDLGITLAIGVGFSVLVGAAITPRPPVESTVGAAAASSAHRRLWTGIGSVVALAAVCGWMVLPGLALRTDFRSYADGVPALRDADHAAAVIGSSAELDIVLRGPDVLTPAAYEWMRTAQEQVILADGDKAHPVVSVPTLLSFLGVKPTAGQVAAGARFVPTYLLGAVAAPDRSSALLSFGVDIGDLAAVDRVVRDMKHNLPVPPPGYRAEVVGLPVVAARGERLVSADRVVANVLGVLAATAVLATGLRRRGDALRACATAVLATGVGFFLLWTGGVALTPMTVAIGALTAAVAAEFTVMLAESARSGRTGRSGLRASVLLAVAASSVGYLSLLASGLGVIREFGLLLAGAVLVSVGCAAVVVRVTVRPPLAEPQRLPDPERILVGVSS